MSVSPHSNVDRAKTFSEVERIFLLAVEMPKHERAQFIKRECVGEREMEKLVVTILNVEGESHSILDNALEAAAAIAFDEPSNEAIDPRGLCAEAISSLHELTRDRMKTGNQKRAIALADLEKVFALQSNSQDNGESLSRIEFMGKAAEVVTHVVLQHAKGLEGDAKPAFVAPNLEANNGATNEQRLAVLGSGIASLESQWPEHAVLFKFRYFVGLSIAESAAAMEISNQEATEKWQFAKAWMLNCVNSR